MGLSANQRIPVAVSMIDAHAGVLGLLATKQARAKGEPENQVSIFPNHFFYSDLTFFKAKLQNRELFSVVW